MSKKLNSVILPSVIEGETQPPCKQSGLSKEEKQEKEAKVLFIIIYSAPPILQGKQFSRNLVFSD